MSYKTQEDFRRVSVEFKLFPNAMNWAWLTANMLGAADFVSAEVGVFYLIQLEPQFDPGRFKVGFAANISDRLRALRCLPRMPS